MMDFSDFELKALLRSCVAGDADSRTTFQNLFGELIYNYPIRTFHLPRDRAADFYIYVFEGDRIFKRVRSFGARNDAQFKTYLNYYVLRDLFLEWQRTLREAETISLATVISDQGSGENTGTLEDLLADPASINFEESSNSATYAQEFKEFLEKLDVDKRLLLKLLHLADFELSPEELRLLSKKSGRLYKEVIADIEETRNRLWKKDERLAALEAQLESIHGWILIYQKELRKLSETLDPAPESSESPESHGRQKEELERKLEWRYRQRRQTLEKTRQFRATTPYKDIARLLNAPLGTVCSLVARIREEIIGTVSQSTVFKTAAVS